MAERLPWFRCYPDKLLGALAAMPPDQKLVYIVLLLRIYEVRGACPDTLEAISRRVGINKRRVSDAIDALFKAGKLERVPDGIMNPFALQELEGEQTFHAERVRAGEKGAAARWKKSKQNQSETDGSAMLLPLANDAYLDLDSEKQRKKDSPPAPPRGEKRPKLKTTLPENWALTIAGAAFANEHGFVGQRVRMMVERFVNHHRSQRTLSGNWVASWNTWVLRQVEIDSRNGRGRIPARATGGPSFFDIAQGKFDQQEATDGDRTRD